MHRATSYDVPGMSTTSEHQEFEKFWTTEGMNLRASARRHLGEQAEDVLQDVALALLEKPELWREFDETDRRMYAYGTLRHKVQDYFRRLKKHPAISLEKTLVALVESESSEDLFLIADQMNLLVIAFETAGLADEEKLALLAHEDFEPLAERLGVEHVGSLREHAKVAGIPKGTAMSRHRGAKRKFLEQLVMLIAAAMIVLHHREAMAATTSATVAASGAKLGGYIAAGVAAIAVVGLVGVLGFDGCVGSNESTQSTSSSAPVQSASALARGVASVNPSASAFAEVDAAIDADLRSCPIAIGINMVEMLVELRDDSDRVVWSRFGKECNRSRTDGFFRCFDTLPGGRYVLTTRSKRGYHTVVLDGSKVIKDRAGDEVEVLLTEQGLALDIVAQVDGRRQGYLKFSWNDSGVEARVSRDPTKAPIINTSAMDNATSKAKDGFWSYDFNSLVGPHLIEFVSKGGAVPQIYWLAHGETRWKRGPVANEDLIRLKESFRASDMTEVRADFLQPGLHLGFDAAPGVDVAVVDTHGHDVWNTTSSDCAQWSKSLYRRCSKKLAPGRYSVRINPNGGRPLAAWSGTQPMKPQSVGQGAREGRAEFDVTLPARGLVIDFRQPEP